MASGLGAKIKEGAGDVALHAWCYGEDQARYLITTQDAGLILAVCAAADVPVMDLGITGGMSLEFAGESISIMDLKEAHESWLPDYMAAVE
jgi:hypothetical protein